MAPRARTAIKENNDFTVMPISFISSWRKTALKIDFNWFSSLIKDKLTDARAHKFFLFRRKSIESLTILYRESSFATMHIFIKKTQCHLLLDIFNNQHIKAWFFHKINSEVLEFKSDVYLSCRRIFFRLLFAHWSLLIMSEELAKNSCIQN